jgi:hypothetical protein
MKHRELKRIAWRIRGNDLLWVKCRWLLNDREQFRKRMKLLQKIVGVGRMLVSNIVPIVLVRVSS